MPDVPPWLGQLTPLGALIVVLVGLFWLLAKGLLIPRSSHERELGLYDKALAEARTRSDEWKETALTRANVIEAQNVQITALTESAKTAAQFFGTVSQGGGDDVA